MAVSKESHDIQYFLIPRDDAGEYIAKAEEILQERGISTYVQTVRPNRQTLTTNELVVMRELQALLPDQVNLPEENPFLTLQVSRDVEVEGPGGDACQCQCGTSTGSGQTCGGGGGGSGHFA